MSQSETRLGRGREPQSISPFDRAVIDFRAVLADPQRDIKSALMALHACQRMAPRAYRPELPGGHTIEPSNVWQLRGLTFEGETAALRRGDDATANEFRNARFSYEDLLAHYDPHEMPQITSMPAFSAHHR